MSLNNKSYRLFEDMLNGFQTNNDGLFQSSVRLLMSLNPNNPYPVDTQEHELFYRTWRHYKTWEHGGIGSKVSITRMLNSATELCKIVNKNPYTFNEREEKREQEELKKQEEARKKEAERKKKEEEIKLQEELKRQEEIRKQQEEKRQEENRQKELEEQKQKEYEDVQFVISSMNNAYLAKDEVTFQQDAIHLMDIAKENPYTVGMDEYEQFSIMMNAYNKNPINKKVLFKAARTLCNIINYTEIYPEKAKKVVTEEQKTILGVIPDEKEEKKTWFSFLNPWKKEGEQNDG